MAAQAPAVVDTAERTKERRFGLATVILILGGGAAGTRVRANRRTNPQ